VETSFKKSESRASAPNAAGLATGAALQFQRETNMGTETSREMLSLMASRTCQGQTMSDPTYEQLQVLVSRLVDALDAWEAFADCQIEEKMDDARKHSDYVRRLLP